jgi:hypothetical protein
MGEEEKEPPFGDKGRPVRLGLVLAFVGLGLLVLLADWALGLIFG